MIYLLLLEERAPYKTQVMLLTSFMTLLLSVGYFAFRKWIVVLSFPSSPLLSFLFLSSPLLSSPPLSYAILSFLPITHISCCEKTGQQGKKSTEVSKSKLINLYTTIFQNVWWHLDHKWLLRSKTINMSQIGNYLAEPICLPGHLAVYKT